LSRSDGKQAADAALTLIEAVVALMVASILVAVAIPTFQGSHRSAQNREAQEEISRVLDAEQAFRGAEGDYTDDPAALPNPPAAVAFHASDPSAGVTMSLNEAAGAVCLERESASGATFAVWASAIRGVFYGQGGGLTGACPDQPPAGYEPGGW
jgi:type II secretory pathway pseudopilin PulG